VIDLAPGGKASASLASWRGVAWRGVALRGVTLCAVAFLGGCSFDTSGAAFGNADGSRPMSDAARADHPAADHAPPDRHADTLRPDQLVPDQLIPDMPPPDACPTGALLCASGCVAQSMSTCGCFALACDPHFSDNCAGAAGCLCGTTPACTGGQKCCGGRCVDVSQSGNCGECGVTCDPAQTCMASNGTYTCSCPVDTPSACTSPLTGACGTSGLCECTYCMLTACDGVYANQCVPTGGAGSCKCGLGASCTAPMVCRGVGDAATCVMP
jgi:hypothetical protein